MQETPLTRAQFLRIASHAGFTDYVFLDESPVRPDAVVLERNGTGWLVYLTDERCGRFETTVRTFDDESAALRHMLVKLRQGADFNGMLERYRRNRRPRRLNDAIDQVLASYPSHPSSDVQTRFVRERPAIDALLEEAMRVADVALPSLQAVGNDVIERMAERHPNLSDVALRRIAQYVTYQLR